MSSIYSIGYGNRKMKEFIKLLHRYKIQYLVDVRSIPYSKHNPPFSQNELHANMKEQTIGYLFLGNELGGRPNDRECYLEDGRVDYEKVETKDFYKEGLERLRKANEGGYQVAIMCSEIKPHECHRTKLIGRSLAKLGIQLIHIDENGDLKSQEDVMSFYLQQIGADKPQQLSFLEQKASDIYTSRKSYLEKPEEIKE